jgi:hypothetical protein
MIENINYNIESSLCDYDYLLISLSSYKLRHEKSNNSPTRTMTPRFLHTVL